MSFRPKGEITQETPQTMSSAFIDQRVFFPVDQSGQDYGYADRKSKLLDALLCVSTENHYRLLIINY